MASKDNMFTNYRTKSKLILSLLTWNNKLTSNSHHVTVFFPVALLPPDKHQTGPGLSPDTCPPNLHCVVCLIQ